MELLITAFNILVLMALWHFGVKKSILDHHRDKLFRLRDSVRQYFLENHSLDHPLYKELRASINAKIAMTEKMTLIRYLSWTHDIINNQEFREAIDLDLKERFRCKDGALCEFVESIRARSSDICISYLINSSFWLVAISYVIRTVYLVRMAFYKIACLEWGKVFKDELVGQAKKRPQAVLGESFKATTFEEASTLAHC